MIKYLITTGASTIVELSETEQYAAVKFSNNVKEATLYDTIGDAMKIAVEANNILGNAVCKVEPIDITYIK